MDEFTERRKRKLTVEQERRLEERVAVLEIRIENSSNRDIETADKVSELISRFDEHVEDEHVRSITTNETMTRVSTTVDNLVHEIKRTNDMLVKFTEMRIDTKERVEKWDTTRATLVSVAITRSVIVGGLWAVYDFLADHTHMLDDKVTQGK